MKYIRVATGNHKQDLKKKTGSKTGSTDINFKIKQKMDSRHSKCIVFPKSGVHK